MHFFWLYTYSKLCKNKSPSTVFGWRLSSRVRPAKEKTLSEDVLLAGTENITLATKQRRSHLVDFPFQYCIRSNSRSLAAGPVLFSLRYSLTSSRSPATDNDGCRWMNRSSKNPASAINQGWNDIVDISKFNKTPLAFNIFVKVFTANLPR